MLPIIVDTREQDPLIIPGAIRATLQYGDYALQGHEAGTVVERKSKADLYMCVGRDRKRFQRRIEDMAMSCEKAYVLIECSEDDLISAPPGSAMRPSAVFGSIKEWRKSGIEFVFFDDRHEAARWVEATLRAQETAI